MEFKVTEKTIRELEQLKIIKILIRSSIVTKCVLEVLVEELDKADKEENKR